jgi:hypothetical protein
MYYYFSLLRIYLYLVKLYFYSKTKKNIIIGPWVSEVGFETLYWIPFLQWIFNKVIVENSRLIIISRGGVESWYKQLNGRYFDIFNYFTLDEFNSINIERLKILGHQKHTKICNSDILILNRILSSNNINDYYLIHPSSMYNFFLPIWQSRSTVSLVVKHSSYLPMIHPEIKFLPNHLPKVYTVAKFYFSDSFPQTKINIKKINILLKCYLNHGPVVLLLSNFKFDDHVDLMEDLPSGLITLSPVNLSNNLLFQTCVISRATRFVGTYGGFSYLAPLLGVPCICVYSDIGRLMPVHMDVAFRVFREFTCGFAEKDVHASSIGLIPSTRYSPMHIDALLDLPGF